MTSFHGTRKSHESFQGREATTGLTQLFCQKEQHGMESLRELWWHSQPCGNQQLSHWTTVLLNKREISPGTGNLANYPERVKSWTLDEMLLVWFLTTFYMSIRIPTDKHGSYFPQEKCFLATEAVTENHNRSKCRGQRIVQGSSPTPPPSSPPCW